MATLKRIATDQWYITRSIADGVTYIGEPHIKEFYRCNMWHVQGRDKDMLVDSGMGVVSLRETIALLTQKACLAVASHTHFDHIGAHHEFAERIVHSAEAELLAHPTRDNTGAAKYVTDEIFTALPPTPYQSVEYAVTQAPATRIVEDGDVIDLGDRHFQVIHTPGHSPGGIALWEASTGILFSGDIVYDGELIEDGEGTNPQDYYTSMQRLYDIPVKIVHGGHYPSYDRTRHRDIIRAWLKAKEAS